MSDEAIAFGWFMVALGAIVLFFVTFGCNGVAAMMA